MNDADLSVCTFSDYDENNYLGIQVGAFSEGDRGMPPLWALHPYGFDSRPLDPDGERGAVALRVFDGSEGFCVVFDDRRVQALLARLSKGASRQYDSLGNFFVIDPEAKKIRVKAIDPSYTIELEDAAGNTVKLSPSGIELTHSVQVTVNAPSVQLSGLGVQAGGSFPLVKAAEFMVWAANVTSVINGLAPGSVVPPVASIVTTITKGS